MKNANVWVICGVVAFSLILGFAAPLEESAERGSSRTDGTDLVSIGWCVPVVAESVKYAEVELRLGSDERRAAFEF